MAFNFSNTLSQPGQTNPTHYFLIKPMTNRFPNPSWTFSNTALSLSLSLSLFQNSMAESFELCLLHSSPPPPPPTAVVLSFFFLWPTHSRFRSNPDPNVSSSSTLNATATKGGGFLFNLLKFQTRRLALPLFDLVPLDGAWVVDSRIGNSKDYG